MKQGHLLDMRDANKHPLKRLGTKTLAVLLASFSVRITFLVCDSLVASMILGVDFCDKFVQTFWPADNAAELEDGTTIPILRNDLQGLQRSQQKNAGTPYRLDTDDKTLPPCCEPWQRLLFPRKAKLGFRSMRSFMVW